MRVAVIVVVLALSSLARAQAPGAAPDLAGETPDLAPPGMTPVAPAPLPPAQPGLRSYSGQILAVDGVAVALFLGAVSARDGEGLAKLSLATYVLGAPIVHLTKPRGARALGSLTIRVAFPIIGAMIGGSMTPQYKCADTYECSEGPSDELLLGALAGVIGASVVDAFYIAKGDPPKAEPSWTPTARATHGGFALGLAGNF